MFGGRHLLFVTIATRSHPRTFFSLFGKPQEVEKIMTVSESLRHIYKTKLLPLEEQFKFHDFHGPKIDDGDFDAKPMVLLVGQYSTGKTTFIRYLLEDEFSGMRIGPEPTTDRFIAVMHGEKNGSIPGNALVVDPKKQFRPLSRFGTSFLNRFQCSTAASPVLESISIVDTPGILSGEKQRVDRGYDFTGVLEWFAGRSDRIILFFDAHKLDVSDEFRRCLEALEGNEDKILIVLNKSDMVDHQQLLRVYGALMWSLGKVFKTPEVSRVYVSSFWNQPLQYDFNRRLFQDEQNDLISDLQSLPKTSLLRKLNDLVKRARLARAHAFIISEIAEQMPTFFGKDRKKEEIIRNLENIYLSMERKYGIPRGDFPDIVKMRSKLWELDFDELRKIDMESIAAADDLLNNDIARLMSRIPNEESSDPVVTGGAFSQDLAETPFAPGKGKGFDIGADEEEWVVKSQDETFESLGPVKGLLAGRVAKEYMIKWSKLPNAVLSKIWKLADVDRDGHLDADEFALAVHFIQLKLEGHELPEQLPAHLVPPSKRPKIQ
uniref:Uncharacterized protein n=1 Tax=Caenorhabditis japonica TaxID=281687 RepID=A0A8R1HS72_CAEJA